MIEVLTLFHGWTPSTKENALRWALVIWNGAVNLTESQRLDCINQRIRGISFTKSDLMEANNERKNQV